MNRHSRAPLLGLLCALSLYYAFVATAGTFGELVHSRSDYYDQLAEGFRAGHLYLRQLPKPELLARANPLEYESTDDWDAWMWDASLYNGHYYVYWGPTPALILLALKLLFRTSIIVVDQWLVLAFALLRLYAGTALIVSYARTQFPELPRWALYLAIVLFAVASPTPYFLARPLVYEACIACGQGFLCLGLYCAYQGLLKPLAQTRWFLAAGSCLGCALGARASMFISAPLIALATAFCAARAHGYSKRQLVAAGLAIGVPIGMSFILYAVYNQLRFDKISEFGVNYQLTYRRFSSEARHFLPNLFSYTTAELSWSCQFPYVTLPSTRHLSTLFEWPSDYDTGDAENGERVGGVLVATIVCWLWSVWLYRAFVWLKQKSKGWKPTPTFSSRELWLMLCSLSVIASLAPASRMYLASMRYLEDPAAGVLFGAIGIGFWLLRPSEARRPRRLLASAVFAGLAAHSIFVGVALGFSGFSDSFPEENKALFSQLERKLSVCKVKRQLQQLQRHTLQTSESAPFFVAWGDGIPNSSRDAGPQGRAARP